MSSGGGVANRRWFGWACGLEGGLVLVAMGCGWLFGLDPWSSWRVDWAAWVWGGVGLLPPLGLFFWVTRSGWAPVVSLRRCLDELVLKVFASWRVWQLAALALAAGVGEELLFRGVVQSGFRGWVGEPSALVLAAVLFGLAHWITPLYAILAGLIGLWLGVVWIVSGSLFAPMLTHAIYDFIALVLIVQALKRRSTIRSAAMRSSSDRSASTSQPGGK